MRKNIVAGNWKMNKTRDEAFQLASDIQVRSNEISEGVGLVLCVPFPYLVPLQAQLEGSNVQVGAQDCSMYEWGAYTGEVSAPMLKAMNIPYVIVGHSERREYHGESGSMLATKVDQALANGIIPIFCCGEPLEIREQGTQGDHVSRQIEEGLFHLTPEQMKKIVIAYEPVWAIGTGKTASAQQAQDMHAHIREHLASKFGAVADLIPILYGGSVKPGNAQELFSCPDVDGGLVGGASLKADDFIGIAQAAG